MNEPTLEERKTALTFEELMAHLDEPSPWRDRPGIFIARMKHRYRDFRLSIVRAWQRWRRGYSEQDTWSLDSFLSPVILGGLQGLRERQLGHPGRYTSEEWDARLDVMIAGFTAATKGAWEMDEDDHAAFKKGAEMFIEDYFDLWD